MNILIVDDDRDVREIVRELLGAVRNKNPSLPELHIHVANNGAAGGFKALQNEIDLVITDCMMPRMTGMQMIRNLRRGNFDKPIVVFSSLSDEKEEELRKTGANEVHRKPITFHILEDIVLYWRQEMLEGESRSANPV